MAKKKNLEENKVPNNEGLTKRLDAIIRILIEKEKIELGNKFNLGEKIRILNSCGLGPSEIAKIFGKKGSSDVAPHLYIKKKKVKKNDK